MDAIPLLCKVCPKQPQFSDISHLLTHVDSKGHLKYYSNAKIRGRADPIVRQQFDDFNDWYEKHGIERLLSQRMLQKDCRKNKPKARGSTGTAEDTKAPKRSRKQSIVVPNALHDDNVKHPIDPQLSQHHNHKLPAESIEEVSVLHHSPHLDIASQHPQYIPSMGSWAPGVDPKERLPQAIGGHFEDRVIKSDLDVEEMDDWLTSPSLLDTSYPDPSNLVGSFPFVRGPTSITPSIEIKPSTASPSQSSTNSGQTNGTGLTHMMRLKGPQWPGMDLFDSASPEAQRMRNQKKEHSSLQQMEYNSTLVQPLERICFLDWSLKMERPITGNVESSPLMEPTPKPKTRKTRKTRAALHDLSTNAPKKRIRRPMKRAVSDDISNGTDAVESIEQLPVPTEPTARHQTQIPEELIGPGIYQDSSKWLLNTPVPQFNDRRSFSIFRDVTDPEDMRHTYHMQEPPATIDYPFLKLPNIHSTYHHHGLPHVPSSVSAYGSSASMTNSKPKGGVNSSHAPVRGAWDHSLRASRTIGAGKENIEPLVDPFGRIDDEGRKAGTQRVTQRYFSTRENEPPQFYEALPSEMDFGGLTLHRLMGSSLNPLNPEFKRGQSQSQRMDYQFPTPLSVYNDPRFTFNLPFKTEDQTCAPYSSAVPGTGYKRTWSDI